MKEILQRTHAFIIIVSFIFIATLSTEVNSKPQSIVYLNSYHPGYQWSDRCYNAFNKALKSDVEIHHLYMDTKRNRSEEYKKNITKQALAFIEKHEPDIIIAADDNASSLIIEPYFKNKNTPIVFLGVNNDPSVYGYPYKNATGIVEVDGIISLTKAIRTLVGSKSIGMIFSTTNTSHKKTKFIRNQFIEKFEVTQVNTAEEWFEKMSLFNETKNFIALDTTTGIKGLDQKSALTFIKENIKIPIISSSATSRTLAHLGYINLPEEQGTWAAKSTDKILNGTDVGNIKISYSNHYLMYMNKNLIKNTNPSLPKRLFQLPHTTLMRLDKGK